ncbi:reverse transcriptase domain-containing protein [Tanacetum coccineum]|uniref:Reverse transcriptase domain-containing protein n=1 Tax=Tanacetum coccineum TaxID=301880 RepID=A0ABQ5C4Y6_9ASTR
MTTLQFADTHNLVAFLSKPVESDGFEQIVDFLNANLIRYALTINLDIYTSCIEQFWATVKVKSINEEVQLQALVDGKKIIVTEASIRHDLQLNDEEGTDCLPNATIFEELTRMGKCAEEDRVTFATGTLTNDALSWWNAYAQPIEIEQANRITWTKLKRLLTNKYCPRTEVKKMEDEFYNLVVKGNDLKTYVRRFQELAVLYPNMVPNSEKLMEVFIGGLPQSIKGNVTASKPQTLEEVTNIAYRLMDQILKRNYVQETNDHKRKFDNKKNTTTNNNYSNNRDNNNYPKYHNNNHSNNCNNDNYQNNHNDHNRNNDYHHQQNRRQETVRTYPTKRYHGYLPLCTRCTLHHTGVYTVKCRTCNKVGHLTRNCRDKISTAENNS